VFVLKEVFQIAGLNGFHSVSRLDKLPLKLVQFLVGENGINLDSR
jgi:hypothetical protein